MHSYRHLEQVLTNGVTVDADTSLQFCGLPTYVRHEHDDSRNKLLACATTRLMRVGPSEPVCRDRFQTASGGADQKSGS